MQKNMQPALMQWKKRKEDFLHWYEHHQWAAIVLGIVATGGILLTAAAMPNVFRAVPYFKKKSIPRKALSQIQNRLKKSGLIEERVLKNGRLTCALTTKGEKRLLHYLLERRSEKRNRRFDWDGRWRLIIYDIPEKDRGMREAVRRFIKQFGFFQLQKNVWVYPYSDAEECFEYIHLLYGKGAADIIICTTKPFDGDAPARIHFRL